MHHSCFLLPVIQLFFSRINDAVLHPSAILISMIIHQHVCGFDARGGPPPGPERHTGLERGDRQRVNSNGVRVGHRLFKGNEQ